MILGIVYNSLKNRIGIKRKSRGGILSKVLRVVLIFNLICFSWIFFRANTVQDAIYVVTHLAKGIRGQLSSLNALEDAVMIGFTKSGSYMTIAFLAAFIIAEIVIFGSKLKFDELVIKKFRNVRWLIYFCLITIIILFAFTKSQQFIYFKY